MKKNETRPPSYATHKNKFKMDQRLSIRLETITILKEILGSKFSDIARSNILCDILPQARETKNINKWDYIKLKGFSTAKKTINKIKITYAMGEHIRQYI